MQVQKYKQTEIGLIPKDWKVTELKDLGIVSTGKTPSTSVEKYWGGNILFITPSDLGITKYVNDTERKVTLEGAELVGLLPKNTVMVVCIGSTIGKTGIIKNQGITNQQINSIICQENVDFGYVYYSLSNNSNLFKNYSGIAAVPIINKTLFEKIRIPLPSFSEQNQISEVLLTVDSRLDIVERERQRIERLKVGIMKKLFDGKKWKIINLSEVVEIFDNKRIPLNSMERSKLKGQYPYCGANGIVDYINKFAYDGEYLLLAEDGGDYGKLGDSSYIMNGKFWVNNHAHVLKAIEGKTTNEFLFYILNFMDLTTYIVGSTRTKLNQKRLQQIQIPLPELKEQLHIIAILKTVDKKLSIQQSKKSKLENIKKSLMNDLLTGEKRIKEKNE